MRAWEENEVSEFKGFVPILPGSRLQGSIPPPKAIAPTQRPFPVTPALCPGSPICAHPFPCKFEGVYGLLLN